MIIAANAILVELRAIRLAWKNDMARNDGEGPKTYAEGILRTYDKCIAIVERHHQAAMARKKEPLSPDLKFEDLNAACIYAIKRLRMGHRKDALDRLEGLLVRKVLVANKSERNGSNRKNQHEAVS